MTTRKFLLPAAASLLAGCADAPAPDVTSVLIDNVRVVDGSGATAYRAAVRIDDGRIVAVGDLDGRAGEQVVDGGGRALAPGFIDTHSHGDDDIFEQPDALPAVSQGITTIVVGQDGGAPFPLADFFAKLEREPAAVNVAAYAGHNTLREEVLGNEYRRVASDEEVAAMAALLQRELAAGALGLSTGLEYEPGIWSARAEVLALARVTAAAGGRYISHVRSEDRWFEDALAEIIEIGRDTGMPVQVSHIKLAMRRLWGEAPRVIAMLDAARAEGVDISADIYPYEYWQSNLMVLVPDRNPQNRDAIAEALTEIAPPEGIRFTRFEPSPEIVGRSLAELAALRETDPVTVFTELAEASIAWHEAHGRGADSIIGTSMREPDIVALLEWPHTNICSDGGFVDLHPRARGAFPRVLGRYVRELGVLGLEEAVHRMTGLAARHMGFADRGVIRPGARADLVLFDPATVADRATPAEPNRLSAGIEAVWVAGVPVYERGRASGARPGRVIRRQ